MARRSPLTDRNLRQLFDLFGRLPRNVQIALVVLLVIGALAYFASQRRPPGGTPAPGPAAGPGEYLFCFWNVENLFDDRDDKRNQIDDDFDNGFAHDPGLRELKYRRISEALLAMNGGAGPDVIACVEVEGVRAAGLLRDALNARIADPGRHYRAVAMKELNAGRHIAPCVITRLDVVPDSTRLHGGNLRILETRLSAAGRELTVFATHWTSQLRQRDGSDGEAGREKYARTIYQAFAAIVRRDPAADVLVCGDFNDTPEAEEVATDLRAVGDRERVRPTAADPLLLDLMAGKSPERYGTLWYGGKPLIYDHVCVSAGLLDGSGWSCDPDRVETVTRGLTRPGATRRQPWRFDAPDKKVSADDRGYADHFPVTVPLKVNP